MISTFKRTLLVQAAVAAMVLPTAVSAQEADSDEGGIADIVVTARKTSETLQTAPVAVSVVTSDKIAALGLNSIDDFAKNATGISFSQAFGRFTDRPVVRGASNVLANVQFGVETGAAYFVDGVYFQGDLQSFDANSIARVEIVKGPQSALYQLYHQGPRRRAVGVGPCAPGRTWRKGNCRFGVGPDHRRHAGVPPRRALL
jgi:iron complex outermembrane recepter protein